MVRMAKKTMVLKTIQTGISIFFSRVSGFARQVKQAQFLGMGVVSDAFLTAFRIPNSLRKIFAEGALSAALVPSIIHTIKNDGKEEVSRLVTLSLFIIETILVSVCVLIWLYADQVISFASPGFSVAQHAHAVPLLKLLIPFIIFISSSAVLAGGLQSVNHFFIPASAQVALNIIYLGTLLLCLKFNLPVQYLAYGILVAGFCQFMLHVGAYWYAGLTFMVPHAHTWSIFGSVLQKFFACLIAMSVMEINLFIDGQFASYLPEGSLTGITYAADFMRIPLGVFAVAFSTILLPQVSRMARYAPKRLSFYLHESLKLIIWITVPVALLMAFFSHDIFYTIYHSERFTLHDVARVSGLLQVFLAGLLFFSINKILLNFYYALHATFIPTIISVVAAILNIALNALLMGPYGAAGLVLATGLSAVFQMVVSLGVLSWMFQFKLYTRHFMRFLVNFSGQLFMASILFLILYYSIVVFISHYMASYAHMLLSTFMLWAWVGPLCGVALLMLYGTRNYFNISIHFLR